MGPRPSRPTPPLKAKRDERPIYIRFACFRLVAGQRTRLGLFQALQSARESEVAPDWALAELLRLNVWFADNMEAPDRFSRSRDDLPGQQGLCWFKPEALNHIARMHELKRAMEACGVHVDLLTTRDPGPIVWEDEHQIVAEPGPRRF